MSYRQITVIYELESTKTSSSWPVSEEHVRDSLMTAHEGDEKAVQTDMRLMDDGKYVMMLESAHTALVFFREDSPRVDQQVN